MTLSYNDVHRDFNSIVNKILDKQKTVIDNNVRQISISIQYTHEKYLEIWRCSGLIYGLCSY